MESAYYSAISQVVDCGEEEEKKYREEDFGQQVSFSRRLKQL